MLPLSYNIFEVSEMFGWFCIASFILDISDFYCVQIKISTIIPGRELIKSTIVCGCGGF